MGIAKHPPSHFGLKHCQQIFSCEVLLKLFLVMHTDNDGIARIHCRGCSQPETTSSVVQLQSSSRLKRLKLSASVNGCLEEQCWGAMESFSCLKVLKCHLLFTCMHLCYWSLRLEEFSLVKNDSWRPKFSREVNFTSRFTSIFNFSNSFSISRNLNPEYLPPSY